MSLLKLGTILSVTIALQFSWSAAISCHQCFYPNAIRRFLDMDGQAYERCFQNPVDMEPTVCPDEARFCMTLQLNMNGISGVMRRCMNPSSLGYVDPPWANTCIETVPREGVVNCTGNITDYKACFCSTVDGCNWDSVAIGGGGSGGCDTEDTTSPVNEAPSLVKESSSPATVLQLPSSVTELPSPVITEASSPVTTEASSSVPEISSPVITETSSPVPEISSPVITETSSPVPETSSPVITETSSPVPEVSSPVITEASSPDTEVTSPVITEASSPDTEVPVTEVTLPVRETSSPVTESSSPVTVKLHFLVCGAWLIVH